MARIRLALRGGTHLPTWRTLLSRHSLRADLSAGLTVAWVAVPWSLAIALGSGVSPPIGLFTAALAGVVCALFGGIPLAVSGPAAAMTVLMASVVEAHGLGGLLIVGIGCGILQLATGVFGLERIVRYIPMPAVAGFTAGLGAILFLGQLPRALGLPPPDQSHVVYVLHHLQTEFRQAQPFAAALACAAAAICLFLPRLAPRLPAPLVAIVLPTAGAVLLHLDVPAVGHVPRHLPAPALPVIPDVHRLIALIGPTWIVFFLATFETVLCATALAKMQGGIRHDSNQELVGQGLANITTALFGGIPVAAALARSRLNVRSGAKTRGAAIFHSVAILIIVLLFAPLIERIPLAALSGVLLAIAIRMLDVSELRALLRESRTDGVVYLVAFSVMVLFGLWAGVQVGLLCAFLIVVIGMANTARIESLRSAAGPRDGKTRPIDRLVQGVDRFCHTAPYAELFQSLADSQSPHTLFITCSDSRIVPSLITSTEPGELFVLRNVGNLIPAFETGLSSAEGAGIEFAVAVLGVREVIVCGHSGCGAMNALLAPELPDPDRLPSLRRWLGRARSIRGMGEHHSPEAAAQLNVLLQLEQITTYPCVRERLADGSLNLHAWYYDIGRCGLYAWDDEEGGYLRLADRAAAARSDIDLETGHKLDPKIGT